MYYRLLFADWHEPGAADDPVTWRYLFLPPFQIANVEMDIPSFVDDVGVLVLCWADGRELAVPVLEGKPLELRVFFDIEQSYGVHSLLIRVTGHIDSFVIACPAADDAGRAIIYWSEDCLASRL